MEENHLEGIISQEFLEDALGRKVDKFVVTSGSKAGDNYSSTMYSIQVHFPQHDLNGNETSDRETAYLIAKCYPNHPARQEMLTAMNFFHTELSFYKVFVAELINMQNDLQVKEIIQPAFPTLVAGHAVNFDEEKVESGKVYRPFDNYIMMVDLRKTFGFRLADRLDSFDRAHAALVVNAMAKNHALGWAYKQKHNISEIQSKFPFINNESSVKGMKELVLGLMDKNGALSYEIIKKELGEQSPVVKGTKLFLDKGEEMLSISYDVGRSHHEYEKHMRVTPENRNNDDIPWNVVIQGDCWTNNMLFRYNEATGVPEDVILLDLQCVRESCPTTDLSYMIYLGTNSEFRKEHLNKILDLYAQKFSHYCQQLKTDPLPGFCAQELKRRFHQSKLFAFCFGLFGLPLILNEKEIDPKDLESIEEGKNAVDMLASFCSVPEGKDSLMTKRIVGLCQDMYDDGII